jgi:integrase
LSNKKGGGYIAARQEGVNIMASVHKKNGNWYMAYIDGQGNRHFQSSGIPHSPVGGDHKDTLQKRRENKAKATLQAIQLEQLGWRGKRVRLLRKRAAAVIAAAKENEAETRSITVRSNFNAWVDKKDVGGSYSNKLTRCKEDFYESLKLRADGPIVDIDEEDINEFVVFIAAKGVSGQTINKRLDILGEMFRDAEETAVVIINPVTEDHYVDDTPASRHAYSVDQIEKILGATRIVDWQTVTLFGCYCGMRLNDARSQTWDAIDWEERVITWIPRKTRRKRSHKAKIIKTPLHPVLYEHLVRASAMKGNSPSPAITPSLVDRPLSNLSDEFIELSRAAGIDPLQIKVSEVRNMCLLSFHSLRHAFATELKRTGAPEKEWTFLTGHSVGWSRWNDEPIPQVAQIYNHVDVSDQRKWMEKLPSVKLQYSSNSQPE